MRWCRCLWAWGFRWIGGLSKDVEDDGDDVADASGEDAEVPGGVVEAELFPDEEGDASGVADAAGDEPGDAGPGHVGEEGADGYDDDPAHEYVEGGGEPVFAVSPHERFEGDADEGEPPDDAEDAPAPAAAEGDEGDGGVGAGDEEVDGGVVYGLKDALGFGGADEVVDEAGAVEDDEGGSEDGGGDDFHGVSNGDEDHGDEADDGNDDS